MGGFFGTISTKCCVNDLFYGTDYNSHLGTRRAGLVTYDQEKGFSRKIHNLERDYFRSKFEDELDSFSGNQGIGVISDTDPQPILVNSHLGRYAVVTVAKINNLEEIAQELLDRRMHFSEYSANTINQTELVALLINMGRTFVEGINLVYRKIEGSCSMLILTEKGIIAARDFLGRTPIVIGQKEGAYAVSSETTSFPNLDYHRVRDLGPGEIVYLTSDSMEVLQEPFKREQICSFLWVYYGFPASDYNGINVEAVREANGKKMGETDDTDVDSVCGVPDSGVGMALGYAEGKGVPYKRSVLKYTPTWPRSFTPGNQERRALVAKMKLIPNPSLLKDQRVVFCDTSDNVQKTLGLLFAADRLLLMNKIEKLESENVVVISDRSFYSSLSYQSPQDWIKDINKFAKIPDMVLLLDLDVKKSVERTDGIDEFENEEFLTGVKANYLDLAKNNDNFVIIDANNGPNKVSSDIKKAVAPLFDICKDCIL